VNNVFHTRNNYMMLLAQNLYFHAMKRLLRESRPREWLDEFLALGDDLSLWIPDRP
jgi:hypothetical protein